MEYINSRYGFAGAVDSRIGGRGENQDDYGMADTPLGLLVVVCDGMGGGPAGSTASSLARETIINLLLASKPGDQPERVLTDAVSAANSALLGAVSANEALRGMGTTCVAILLTPKTAFVAHVGDSRCYQLRGGKVVFRTADHSYVAEMVRKGELTEEDARLSAQSNVITRAIGVRPVVETDIDQLSVKPGDRFALMSDGIWGMMGEQHLVNFLSQDEQLDFVVAELADRVDAMGHNNGGDYDNLTLALVTLPAPQTVAAASMQNSTPASSQASAEQKAGAPVPPVIPACLPEENNKTGWFTIALSALLGLSLAINIYFLLRSEPQSTVSPAAERLADKVVDERKSLVSQLQKENEELKENKRVLMDAIDSLNDVINRERAQAQQRSQSAQQRGNARNDNPSRGNSRQGFQLNTINKTLDQAVEGLQSLQAYDPKLKNEMRSPNQKKDFAMKRKKKFSSSTIGRVKEASNLSKKQGEAELKQRFDQLASDMDKDIKLFDCDSKGRTTAEGQKSIQKFINIINKLKQQ